MDLTRQKFNKLTAIGQAPNIIIGSNTYTSWYCQCDCGNICIVNEQDLVANKLTSCGCDIAKEVNICKTPKDTKVTKSKTTLVKDDTNTRHPVDDLAGQRFGRLTVLPKYEIRVGKNNIKYTYWLCKCDCGKETFVSSSNLKSGHTNSCGCYRADRMRKHTEPIVSKKVRRHYKQRARVLNKYDLTAKSYGIGYCSNDDSEFYFDLEDYDKIKNYTWSKNDGGYIVTQTSTGFIPITSLIIPDHDNFIVSHVHGKDSAYDNRKSNLRLVDRCQALWGASIRSNNTSGVTGVCYDTTNDSWIANICFYGKKLRRRFSTKQEAIAQRKIWENRYFGEYSYDNSRIDSLSEEA